MLSGLNISIRLRKAYLLKRYLKQINNVEAGEVMYKSKSKTVFTILFGAFLIVSIMPAPAEISFLNHWPEPTDPLIGLDESASQSNELDDNPSINNESIRATMLILPLSFIENLGQSPENVRFIVKTAGQTVFLTISEVVFALSRGDNSVAVHMSFENSSPGRIAGEQPLPGRANFFIGNNSSQWIDDVPTFGSVRYQDLYPGVDLIFKGREGFLKHELVLSPGSDPSQIIIRYSGHDNLSLTEDGSVLIMTPAGNLTDSAPICYQEINGSIIYVEGKYRTIDDQRIGFEIGSYDRGYALVIDPSLLYSTYLGGGSDDSGLALAIDSCGNAYIAGYTASANFPVKNPIQASNRGSRDAFIAKIDATGSALLYSTYFGGSQNDSAHGIAVDGSGNAYVTGPTYSTNFPTRNPIQASNAGMVDSFVTKINAVGSTLIYSTYLGGKGNDYAEAIALDCSGNAYITGYTDPASFPTRNPIQASNAGLWDAFVTKINAAGSALVYSTYLGGSGFEYGLGIATDSKGNAYVTGPTYSTNFPTKNPIQASNAGMMDTFITKINAAGSALIYSTYFGGSFNDYAEAIALDSNRNAYITGYTISTDLPIQMPIQASNAGIWDAFVTKIDASGSALLYSTYLGGSGICFGHGIAVDAMGNAYVTGETNSTDFPTINPIQASNTNSYDVFISKINANGMALDYSTYLGGDHYDYAKGIAVDADGNAFITGYTESANFPINHPIKSSNTGYKDVFVTVVSASEIIPNQIGAFRNGPWYLDYNGNHAWDPESGDISFWFGTGGDLPLAGDWNGDGIDDIGVFRNGPWYLDYNGNHAWDPESGDISFWFGTGGDLPLAGDWNGDGIDDIGVFRNGLWYLDYNGNHAWDPESGDVSFWFGTSGDLPLAGDWNGDGIDDIGVFRNGPWYLDYNGNHAWDPESGDVSFWFGTSGDLSLAGDWNGDGRDEIGVFRNGPWYMDYNGNMEWDPVLGDISFWFGAGGDLPLAGRWSL